MNYRPHDDAGDYCREVSGLHVFLVIGMMIVRRMGKNIEGGLGMDETGHVMVATSKSERVNLGWEL
jgi:hypothetical protein